ncbi:MAG: SGNH hydrolase domain-containing protein [Solirubrobacteraceae bacterium]
MRGAAVLIAVAALALASGATAEAKLRFEPKAYDDRRDVAGGPLDLTSVAFGQQDTRMFLRIRTATAWDPAGLSVASGRALCLVLLHRPLSRARTRVCLGPGKDTALRYAHLDAAGRAGPEHPVPATVARPDARTIEARFAPLEVDLPSGGFAWQVTSSWRDDGVCRGASPCVDRAPEGPPMQARRGLLAQPRCFGAASRARRRCYSPALRLAVVPTPDDSLVSGNAPCDPVVPTVIVYQCTFGVSPARASSSVALVGDSFAVAWRGALEVVAQHKRWHAITMSRGGCPLSKAQVILPTPEASADCTVWNRLVQLWFKQHPEVSTVVASAHPARFTGNASRGYREAWQALPPTVKRIYVVRSFPFVGSGRTERCVERAIRRRRPAGIGCAQSRKRVLKRDPMAATASRLRSGRVRLIDMTRYMCDRRRCYPVVGGALVNKPTAHLTRIFSTTLGPFMLRAFNRAR